MVTLQNRRDYWVHINGSNVYLRDKGGVVTVPPDQPVTKEELEAIPEADVGAWLAEQKLTQLEARIQRLTEDKVAEHIDPIEKPYWMGMADAFTRQHNLWLEEFIVADIEERMPDEITYPPLTVAEKQTWANLAVIQKLTAAIRDAATAIANQ